MAVVQEIPKDGPAPAVRAGRTGRTDYGIDAPGVVWGLGLAGVAGAVALAARLLGLWSERSAVGMLWAVVFAGLSCGATALVMVWDSEVGKVRRRDRLLDSLAWRGDETVLDVGCGRGLYLLGAARRVPRGRAVGVDVWNAQDLTGNSMAATERNARAEGVADRVELKTADARQLRFADATFDYVFSSMALHNIYEAAGREKAVREIARVLKPGGRVVLVDMRHTAQYADVLRSAGAEGVTHSRPWTAPLVLLLTWGAVRPGRVTGRRPAAVPGLASA